MATRTRARAGRRATIGIATTGAACCTGGVCDPQRVHKLLAPAPVGTHQLVNVTGPGVFVAGHVTKTGGATGLTFVRLVIDGRVIVDVTFGAARTFVFPIDNPYGVLRFSSGGDSPPRIRLARPPRVPARPHLDGDRERARSRPAPRRGHRRQHPLLAPRPPAGCRRFRAFGRLTRVSPYGMSSSRTTRRTARESPRSMCSTRASLISVW